MNLEVKKFFVSPGTTIRDTVEVIEMGASQLALVVNDGGKLLGIVSDGDVRRSILKDIPASEPVERIMNPKPQTILEGTSTRNVLRLMRRENLRHFPVVNSDGVVIDIWTLSSYIRDKRINNPVLLMAGGKGTRLRPLTENTPKPMLKVGKYPLLELNIRRFVDFGFHRFFISINYLGEQIRDYFGDGSKWDADIQYIEEDRELGTAGALSLLPNQIHEPLTVINGDILTRLNFAELLDFHESLESAATMGVRSYNMQVPYGVVKVDGNSIVSIDEKPIQNHYICAGVYVLNPEVLSRTPHGIRLDMPDFFEQLSREGLRTSAFPIRESWFDIGTPEDLQKAQLFLEAQDD